MDRVSDAHLPIRPLEVVHISILNPYVGGMVEGVERFGHCRP